MQELPFEAAEFDRRLDHIVRILQSNKWDALLTFTQENQYWICGYETTGFHSFPQALVVTNDGRKQLVTRQLEIENATENAYDLSVVSYQDDEDPGVAISRVLSEMGLARATIGLEKKSPWITIQVFEALRNELHHTKFEDCSGVIELLRSVKSPAELQYMRLAARCVGAAMRAGIDAVEVGISEFDVAARLSKARIAAGSHFTRNPTYISSGKRSARGHASWNGRTIQVSDVVFFEVGANVRHYDVGLVRSAVAGSATAEMQDLHDASCSGLEAALSAVVSGARACDVHRAVVAAFEHIGVGRYFDHRIGYGIGIEFLTWIERGGISLDSSSKQILQPNMTLHLVPFLKVPGKFSIGVSETICVTETGSEIFDTGCPRVLSVR